MPSIFFPAPKQQVQPAIVLAIFLSGVVLGGGSVAFLDRIGQSASAGNHSGWKRAKDWAKLPGLSKERKLALEWMDKNLDDPTIQVIEFEGTWTDRANSLSVVSLKARIKDQNGSKAETIRVFVYDDGDVSKYTIPVLYEELKRSEPSQVIDGRQP